MREVNRAGAGAARPQHGILHSILTVGFWTLASRILGFLRDVLIAEELGAGMVADAFFVALKLPNLFRRLFGEGAFSAAFIPAFAGMLATEGREKARRFAEEVSAVLILWLALFSIAAVLVMPWLMFVLAPGFAEIPEKFALAVHLTRITFPYLLLICVAAECAAVLNGLDRFAAAAAAPLLFNIFLIAALLFLTPYVPTAGHALAYGVTASGVAQLVVLLFAVAHAGVPLRLRLPRLTPAVRLVMRRMAPGIVGVGVTQINLLVDTIVASFLASGSVSVLYYADRINQLPLGVIGAAVGTALLPVLSREVRAHARLTAHRTLNRAIEFTLALTLPAAVGLGVVAFPIVRVLFERGAFSQSDVALTAAALAAYALGVPGTVLAKVLAPRFFADGDTATPVAVAVVAMVVNIALIAVFVWPLRATGIALAASLSALLNAALLWLLLARRRMLTPDRRLRARAPRMVVAAVLMGVLLVVLGQLWAPGPSAWLRLLRLVVLVVAGAAAYAASGTALGAFSLSEFRRRLGARAG